MLVCRSAVKRTEQADRGNHGKLALPERPLRSHFSSDPIPQRLQTTGMGSAAPDCPRTCMKVDGMEGRSGGNLARVRLLRFERGGASF